MLEGKEAVIDRRTDVFQLGSLLYELVSGIKPEGHYEDLQGELAPLNDVVKKARQRQQVNRYQTVEELLQDFRDKTQTKAITTRQQTLEQKAQAVETEKYEAGTLETAREASSSLYKIIKGTLKGTLDFVKPFFIFPTRVRKGLDENEPKFSAVQVLGMPLMGCLANFANGIATVGTYIDEGGSDYWKFGIIPIATNLASGAYEFWRHCRNKIVEKKRTFQTSLSPQEKELAKLKQYNPFEQSRVIADYIINELRGSTPSDFTRVKSKQSEGFDITIDDKKIAEIVANRVYIDSANSSVQEIVSKAREKLKIYIETTESYEYERRLSSVNNSDGLDRGRVIGDYLVDRLSRLSQNRYKVERKSQHAREYVVLLGNKEIATIDDERVIYVHDEHLFERIKRIAEESKGEYKVHVGQAFKVPN